MLTLRPITRRLVYVISFETLAIVLSTVLLMILSSGNAGNSLPIAIATSVIAFIWNYIFNTLFEMWERLTKRQRRNLTTRIAHATLFEGGFFMFTTPMYMWWYKVTFLRAVQMELSILVFFMLYTFLFTLIFDWVVALPQNISSEKS